MIIAGRKVRLFDPWVLLLWALPLAIVGTRLRDPFFPYQLEDLAHGAFGFPLAFGAWAGVSSGENIISILPYAIDLVLIGGPLYLIGLALRMIPWPEVAWLALSIATLFCWPLALLNLLVFDTWALNWWSLGSPDFVIG